MKKPKAPNDVAIAMMDTLISPNESDRNGENANVVDGLFAIARAINRVAKQMEEEHLTKVLGSG